MKKLLFLVATVIVLYACNNEPKPDYAIISGKIENPKDSIMKLYSQFSFEVEKEIKLNEDGSFKDSIEIEKNNLFVLRQARTMTELFLDGKTAINLEFDAEDYRNTISISGDNIAPTQYFIDKNKATSKVEGFSGNESYKKEEKEFKEIHQKVKNIEEDLLFNYAGLTEEFKQREKKAINYSYLGTLSNYESYHTYYAKKKDFKVSDGFLAELKSVDLNNESDFLYSASYRGLVTSKVREESSSLIEKDSLARDIAMLQTISKVENPIIKNSLLYDQAKYGIIYTKDLEDFYAVFSEHSTDESNNKIIKESYTNLKKLAKGSKSPQFKDYENYVGGTTSLSDLKGDYVSIDVWATWCGPCIAEIPSLKKVEKQFHDEDIQFLSISIDNKEDREKWKKMIGEKELGGMQLFADNAWESKFITDYMIKGIPRFILLDKEGNIIDANAPRPSDKKLVNVLNNLNANSKGDLKLQP